MPLSSPSTTAIPRTPGTSIEGGDTTVTAVPVGLGLGWNFGFVAGSAQLSSSLPEDLKIRARGLADSTVWIAAAVSSLLSSVLFEALGFANLSWLGAFLSAGLGLCLLAQRAASREPDGLVVEP